MRRHAARPAERSAGRSRVRPYPSVTGKVQYLAAGRSESDKRSFFSSKEYIFWQGNFISRKYVVCKICMEDSLHIHFSKLPPFSTEKTSLPEYIFYFIYVVLAACECVNCRLLLVHTAGENFIKTKIFARKENIRLFGKVASESQSVLKVSPDRNNFSPISLHCLIKSGGVDANDNLDRRF